VTLVGLDSVGKSMFTRMVCIFYSTGLYLFRPPLFPWQHFLCSPELRGFWGLFALFFGGLVFFWGVGVGVFLNFVFNFIQET